jgi:hypothetical protein
MAHQPDRTKNFAVMRLAKQFTPDRNEKFTAVSCRQTFGADVYVPPAFNVNGGRNTSR